MSAMQQPTPNHQSETFGSGQTQFFECEALSADHPEIQAPLADETGRADRDAPAGRLTPGAEGRLQFGRRHTPRGHQGDGGQAHYAGGIPRWHGKETPH